ncbi:HEAT repeat domain-containing protein [Methylovulum psychrotolerans]|uniref:HEAT repeat domain-containing protein n=1 Tax=Methylovulum psychrotolerans TaxID=1704499 RepID=UPI0018DFAE21|nr:HEAT repeat domain-containing protein [Methylovulum psychrotolerans]MBT9098266.1 HEAT repeat domain-containing protein [Methylovulum psychrotolerans]
MVENLQEQPYKTVRPLLLQAFADKHYVVRSAAAEVFGDIGDEHDIDKLLPLLTDPHYQVRYITAETLGQFNSPSAILPLIAALDDENDLVRINAAESLGRLKALNAIAPLTAKLTDSDELVRGYAAEALGVIGDKTSILPLKQALACEKRHAARVRLLTALYRLGETAHLATIIKQLNSKNYRVRCATTNILTELAFDYNLNGISEILAKRLAKEPTIAVKSTLTRCLEELAHAKGNAKPATHEAEKL